jgi:tRNA (guanine-N7-)-methyltransferase
MVDDPTRYPNGEPVSTVVQDDPRRLPLFNEIFGNTNPVEVEIGCGKAKFLLARASEFPQINFLGIDIVWKWMKYAVRRSENRSLANIKFLRADARETIRHGFVPGSVSIFHVYFPDPWPKRKHRKHRLITGAFLRLLHDRLTDTGLIELATDHPDYFLQMEKAAIQSGISWKKVRKLSDERLFEAMAKTNYEIKYEAAGRKLNYLEIQK